MKIVIISDIHGNLAALNALPERNFDELWCIGDLVDYGPNPHEVVEWVRQQATVAVRGNHDHAGGFSVDPQCSAPFKKLAEETLRFTQQVCTDEDLGYLRSLPVRRELTVNGTRFYLVHAIPSDPLFGYCPEESDRWKQEVEKIDADVLIVGHRVREITRSSTGNVPACCLVHLAMTSAVLGRSPATQLLLGAHSRFLERLGEDAQRYALRHDALRRYLTSEEERRASQLLLLMLAGHRNVGAPWQVEFLL